MVSKREPLLNAVAVEAGFRKGYGEVEALLDEMIEARALTWGMVQKLVPFLRIIETLCDPARSRELLERLQLSGMLKIATSEWTSGLVAKQIAGAIGKKDDGEACKHCMDRWQEANSPKYIEYLGTALISKDDARNGCPA